MSYTLYVSGEMKSVSNTYKINKEKHELENSLVADERYQNALEAM